jgi:general nucleoside transport system permease protein
MLRFEKRENASLKLRILVPIVSVIAGLIIGAIAILLARANPLIAYKSIVVGAFGSKYTFTETLVFATPLILLSVGLILAFKMNFWNVGAYGQFILGAIFSSYFALFGPADLPRFVMLGIMTLAGLAGGAIWALIPAVLKAYWKVNEVISTLLLNYIALNILRYLMYGPWRDPTGHGFPLSKTFALNAQLPKIIPNSRTNLGLAFGIIAAFIIWFIIKKTKFGYRISIIGGNPNAARYAGINVARNIILGMLISGALAGLAGMVQISGIIHLLQIDINPYYGYTAIIVAWLSYLNPIVAIFVSILFGALAGGGYQIQMTLQVPFGIISVIESGILFVLIGSEILLRCRVSFVKRRA